jgi:MinD-like ATPase involved in chromosome partitioning or flagellar assembly
MRLRIVTAGVGAAWESSLVHACQAGSVRAVVVQRCYDLGDLLAVAAAGRAEVALVAAAMRWLDREAVSTIRADGLGIVGVVQSGDEDAERRLRQMGVDQVAQGSARPASLVELARVALVGRSQQRTGLDGRDHDGSRHGDEVREDPVAPGGLQGPRPAQEKEPGPLDTPHEYDQRRGELIAAWGPKGAPGRTTIAVNLAFEALPYIGETLLVDADTYGGSISQMLGFLDDHPSLAWAARLAGRGELDGPKLLRATRRAGAAGPRVLSGLPRADLWTEVRPSTWHSLLDLFTVCHQLTVIDLGFCLEEEEELVHDHVRFRRNAVSRIALQRADHVIAVARADPVGLHDFIRGYQQLRDLGVEPDRIRVVVNQVRSGVFGGDAATQIRAELARYLGVEPSALVPYDRASMDAALGVGKALREVRRGSPAQQAIAAVAAVLVGAPPMPSQRHRLRRRRERRRAVVWDGRPSGPTMTSRNLGW